MAFENIKRARRSLRVARTGARIYFGYKRTQRSVKNLDEAARTERWEQKHAQFAEDLYRLAVDLKGLYIKTGQFMGTRSDMVPPAYVASLSRLQDQVPARPVATIRQTIEEELGKPVEALFATFDDVPLAAASLAQVHRATLADGREVCVKVQYPEVAGLVKLDVRNLRTIVGLVARRERNFDFRAVVNEIGTQVPLELDFVREAALTKRVKENLRGYSGIVVPGVVDEFTRRKVLVTEFLPGEKVIGEGGRAAALPDGPAAARAITEAFGHQIMVDGLFQADPHPGNLLAMPDGRIGLLDFGLTKELPQSSRLGFARLVVAAANRNPQAVIAAFAELGLKTRGDANPEGVLALTQLFFDARPERREMGGQRRQALQASPIDAIPGDLVLLGRVVGLLRGVCKSLGATLTPMEMLRPYAERVLAEIEAGTPAAVPAVEALPG